MFVQKNIDELEGVYELRTFVWTTRILCVAFLFSTQNTRMRQTCQQNERFGKWIRHPSGSLQKPSGFHSTSLEPGYPVCFPSNVLLSGSATNFAILYLTWVSLWVCLLKAALSPALVQHIMSKPQFTQDLMTALVPFGIPNLQNMMNKIQNTATDITGNYSRHMHYLGVQHGQAADNLTWYVKGQNMSLGSGSTHIEGN